MSPTHLSASNVIQKHADQQRRRRGPAKGRGSSTKSSIWSTIAASIHNSNDKPKFQCKVCNTIRSMNKAFSNSNIILHYKTHHKMLYEKLQAAQERNQTELQLKNLINKARHEQTTVRNPTPFSSFYADGDTSEVKDVLSKVPVKLLQSVSMILYACYSETPMSRIATPLFQGLVHILKGRVQFASKKALDSHLIATYKAVCEELRNKVMSAKTGSLTFDGWSAALGAPILGITWHYIDTNWCLRSVSISTLNLSKLPKNAEKMMDVLKEVTNGNLVVGSDSICISTVTTDNEPATARAADMFTNYTGSVRCVVHTLALVVNDVFIEGTVWQSYMDLINKVTTYFNYHSKANMLLKEKQLSEGVTQDRLQSLKHDVPTRWHSRLGAMTTYLTRAQNISDIADELHVSTEDLPRMSQEQLNGLIEIIAVLKEVRRVARQLEADKYVTMSRAPRIMYELFETLQIMAGEMIPNSRHFYETVPADGTDSFMADEPTASPVIPSTADFDLARDRARDIRLIKPAARTLSRRLAERLQVRLGHIWRPVDSIAITWEPSEEFNDLSTVPNGPNSLAEGRRVLLFHFAAIVDTNECELEFIGNTVSEREQYHCLLYDALINEVIGLQESATFDSRSLNVLFGLFHKQMRKSLRQNGRKGPEEALLYWKKANECTDLVSPLPFNLVARALLASQASSAAAERLFSDLGRLEGFQCNSLLSSTSEMCELIRVYVRNEIEARRTVQRGLLHSEGDAFVKVAREISALVWKAEGDNC